MVTAPNDQHHNPFHSFCLCMFHREQYVSLQFDFRNASLTILLSKQISHGKTRGLIFAFSAVCQIKTDELHKKDNCFKQMIKILD